MKEGDPALQNIEDDETTMDTLQSIENDVETLSSLSDITEISMSIDQLTEHLSELWSDSKENQISYQTFVRITTLVDRQILGCVQKIFDGFDLLNIKKSSLKVILSFTQAYITGISQICNPATTQPRLWKMDPYQPRHMIALERLTRRFIDVVRILADISGLLDSDELETLHFSSIANSVQSLVPTRLLSHPARVWDSQFRLFEARLSQAERCAASKLHAQLMSAGSSPEVVLQAFKAHPMLLMRQAAIQELGHELSEAQSFILSQTQRTLSLIVKKSNENPVDNLIWFQQKKANVEQYLKFTHALPEAETIQNELRRCGNELKAFAQAQMKRWVADIQAKLPTTLQIPKDGNLVDFGGSTTGGTIVVKFSDDLCVFLEDVRRLSAAKLQVPKKIQELASRAEPFYKQALIMQRVAMFYNNMTDRIITCQKPMLLQPADDFEKLAKSARNLDQKTAPQLLTSLQASLSNIMEQNSALFQEHKVILGEIKKLADIDLIDKRSKWTTALSEIRQKVQLVAKGYSKSEFWVRHLDAQLYKILQFQFRNSLLMLSERSAQIEVSLYFADNRLQFRPVIEEIRRMYYQSVSDLLVFPKKFRGIGHDSTFFSPISGSASDIVFFVYQKGELLIQKVFEFQFQFKEWSILADNLKNIEERCESITTAAEWKSNLSLVAMRKESINKIDDSATIGCFKIDTTQAKEGFRRLLSQFQSLLVQSLRKTLRNEFEGVQKFVSEGTELMNMQFDTSEAIAESRRKFEDLVRSKVEIELTFTSLTEKVNLLKSFESIEHETEEFDKLPTDSRLPCCQASNWPSTERK